MFHLPLRVLRGHELKCTAKGVNILTTGTNGIHVYWIPNIIIITKSNASFLVNSNVLAETVLARVEFKEERLDITASDLATLRKGAWVNDQVKHTAYWPWNEQL